MPFTLAHKASKKSLRRNTPSPLDLSASSSSSLPTPPPTGEGFKMFWQKKKTTPTESPRPYYPTETPRPILQKPNSTCSPTSIRFVTTAPDVVVTPPSVQPRQTPTQTRRSSRPTSPSSSSFGARIRTSQYDSFTPGPVATHITTPPTAYVSTMQERAPPPPSPYRPTSERARTSTSFPRPLPELSRVDAPPRHSSLFASSSMVTIDVPMVNIIPATPQNPSDEFTVKALQDSMMEEIPLDSSPPSVDVDLDFSPFSPTVDLPSPPFESFPSLPSLVSHPSLPSLPSSASSASSLSLCSFPDVEEALGSMLASLSDNMLQNPGLGLGLDFEPCDNRVNHRKAFYQAAQAAPSSADYHTSSMADLDGSSLRSESSDDDLHTASIISLTPVLGDRARVIEVLSQEVGLAL